MTEIAEVDVLMARLRDNKEPVEAWLVLDEQRIINLAQQAFHKDVNAAIRCAEILVPRWKWNLSSDGVVSIVRISPLRPMPIRIKPTENLGRTLLLAVITAWREDLVKTKETTA